MFRYYSPVSRERHYYAGRAIRWALPRISIVPYILHNERYRQHHVWAPRELTI